MSKNKPKEERYLPPDLTRIQFEKGYFNGAEHRYHIQADILSVGRYQEYEKMAIYFAFGTGIKAQIDNWATIHKKSTSGNNILGAITDISTIAYNQLHALGDLAKKDDYEPRVLWFCTLFCNREGEDLTRWSQDEARRKIQDWKAANIPIQDFFLLTRSVLKSFGEIYNELQAKEGQAGFNQ